MKVCTTSSNKKGLLRGRKRHTQSGSRFGYSRPHPGPVLVGTDIEPDWGTPSTHPGPGQRKGYPDIGPD